MRHLLAPALASLLAVTEVPAQVSVPPSPFARAEAALRQLRATDLSGREWSLDTLRGRVTLIDLWATWCAPCLEELSVLRRMRAAYGRDELEVLGISIDVASGRDLRAWLARHRVDWPQIHDGRGLHGPLARLFGIRGVPASFLVGADGRVVGINMRGQGLLRAVRLAVERRRAAGQAPTSTSSFDAARVPMVIR